MNEIEYLFGYPITRKSKEQCIDEAMSWIESDTRGRRIVCANPHSLEVAHGDPDFREALRGADLVLPDGAGLVLASKILGGKIRARVTGSDLFWGISRRLEKKKEARVFFLGSTEDNLDRIKDRMSRDFPNIRVAGTCAPPFRREFSDGENASMVNAINRARPDVLWVGMTAPKQEKWIHRNRDALDVKLIGAIGAVFDFYTGKVKRPHLFFQRLGLEWLPRFLREPRRLWRRNLVSNPRFLLRIIRSRLSQGSFLSPANPHVTKSI